MTYLSGNDRLSEKDSGDKQRLFYKNDILALTISALLFLAFLALPTADFNATARVTTQDCTILSPIDELGCKLSQGVLLNFEVIKQASSTLKGEGLPLDIAQDVIGFRALTGQDDPYPVIQEAVYDLGFEWRINHASTHPPTAFLVVAPIGFFPWKLASAIWAWTMLGLLLYTIRLSGFSWEISLALTPIVLLWPPITTSLGQLTILWLFAVVAGYHIGQQHPIRSGVLIGIATITKFFPSIIAIDYLIRKQWKAFVACTLTFVLSGVLVLLLNPNAIHRYVDINKKNSMAMVMRQDNASLLFNSFRWGGWIGLGVILLLFLAIIFANKKYFQHPLVGTTPLSWLILLYFSVALLPVAWVFSLAPLLPIIFLLNKNRNFIIRAIGICCILIPYIFPAFGTGVPAMFVVFLIGLGLLFNGMVSGKQISFG
ncbi:MAG: DUF2029 domain-containing protein [Anaerolineales bacterium]|nr:DUF2029 domain-containing protein [Anaerolineales bacterium]